MIPTPRSTFAVALVLTAALIGILPSEAASDRRSFLVFRGSVLDSAGHPIREAWVTSVGSRRSGTLVDPTGHFMLPIRCEPLEVIARRPFTLRIQARHKGWSIALPDGSHELGLEIGLSADSTGLA